MLVYVHTRWRRASPQVRAAAVKHNDVLCVTMRIGGREFSFLSVYTDCKTFEAVTYLLDRIDSLPTITFMAGEPSRPTDRDGVLGLVWVNPALGTVDDLQIDDLNRERSDHAVLR